MYNKTGYHTESWDTPTPLGNCHHWCLTGNACGPRGTRPFVRHLRPEAAVRMRQQALECIVRSGDYTWNPTDSRACADSPSDARERRRGFTGRVAWHILFRTGSKQNDQRHDANPYV